MRHGKAIGVLLLLLTAAPPLASQVSVVAPNEMEVQMTARMEPGSVPVPSGVIAVVRSLPPRRPGSRPEAVLCVRRVRRTEEWVSGSASPH